MHFNLIPSPIGRLCLVAFFLLASSASPAEELDLSLPSPSLSPSASTGAHTVLSPVESFIDTARPVLVYSYTEVDGLLAAPGSPTDSTVQTFTAIFTTEFAQTVMVRYSPSWVAYSNDAFDDAFAHNALLQADIAFTEWNTQFAHHYYRADAPLLETGRQTTLESHSTNAHAERRFTEKIGLVIGVRQTFRLVEDFVDFREWATDNSFDYRLSSAITTSGTFSYGYVDVDGGPNMSYQRYGARLRWQPLRAVVLDLHGGYETRKTSRSVVGHINTPIYGASLQYRPVETTTVAFTAERQLTPSFFQNQLVRTNTWRIAANQRLLGRFFLSLDWMHRNRSYWTTHLNLPSPREDRGSLFRAAVSTRIREHTNIAVFYQKSRNRSTSDDFDVSGRRVGVELQYRF